MEIKYRPSYYYIATLYDELDDGGDQTSIRKEIGQIIADNVLDKRICELMQKSIGVRYMLKGFHDDSLLYVNLDKSDCQIIMYGDNGLRDADCPFRLKFEGVVDCICNSLTALTNEKLYCQREDINLLHDGNIAVEFTFSNYGEPYVPRAVKIICKGVTISAAPEYK